jgi:hypothetical protein
LPLLTAFVAVLAVVLGWGSVLGAPSLIWHDLHSTQLLAGFALAMLCVHLGMVGYLLDSRENTNQVVAPDFATLRTVARYLIWPLDVLMLAVALGFRRQGVPFERAHGAYVLFGPVVISALVIAAGWGPRRWKALIDLFPKRVHPHLVKAAERGHALAAERHTTPPDPGAHAVQGLMMLLLLAAYFFAWGDDDVPAAVAVSVALGLALGFWGLLRFWFRRYRLFWSAVLIVVACWIGVTRDVPAPRLSNVTFPVDGVPPRHLADDCETLNEWRGRFPTTNPPLVIVATSGGALRAAIWTLNVLGGLEERLPGFLAHVRIITGASGGMVGAAHLVSALATRPAPATGQPLPWIGAPALDRIIDDAAKDSLTAVTRALILPGQDRGRALEEVWEENTRGRLERPFRDLLRAEEEGWLPSLVYSPLLVEDGRRLLISNLDLAPIARTLGPQTSCPAACEQSISAVQLFACGGEVDRVKLSTVARLNATFPWVTSAALLGSTPDRRVVDAGYYDNYGVDVATAWIHENADWLEHHTSGVLLLQIRDEERHGGDVTYEAGPSRVHEWVSAVSTPIEGFLSAWSASMSFRNDQKIEVLAGDPRLHPESRFFATETFELSNKAPLEWYLDHASIDLVRRPLPPEEFDSVVAWWQSRPDAPPAMGPWSCPKVPIHDAERANDGDARTIFLSYRSPDAPWAIAVRENLVNRGYDVFLDKFDRGPGDVKDHLLENIRRRRHFLLLLTPSTFERPQEQDWLTEEVVAAMDSKRNVASLLFEHFDFDAPHVNRRLKGRLRELKDHAGMPISTEAFPANMDQLVAQILRPKER